MSEPIRLRDFVDEYVSARDISDSYANQLYWFVNALERSAHRSLMVSDLQIVLINDHLKSTRNTLSAETRKSHRRMALTLWQAAADCHLVPEPSRRKVMRIRTPDHWHRSWTTEQVQSLLQATQKLCCTYQGGMSKSCYWRSYILGAWDSGLRGCDMRRVRREDIDREGRAVVIQHKTGRLLRVCFRPETMAAIHASFPPNRDLVWPLWGRIECWRREAQRLVSLAGLRGSIGQLRHSSGTAVELLYPGHGHEHLGNTRQVFERHYLDHQRVQERRLLPESLLMEKPHDCS